MLQCCVVNCSGWVKVILVRNGRKTRESKEEEGVVEEEQQ